MKISKYQLAFIGLFILSNLFAQDLKEYPNSIIKIETEEKIGEGYFFIFELTKDKVNYNAIVVKKALLRNSPYIKLHFKQFDTKNPYILNIKNNKENIIEDLDQDNDFILIPFGNLRYILEEKNIKTEETFLCEAFIPQLESTKSESDISKLKAIWEASFSKSL